MIFRNICFSYVTSMIKAGFKLYSWVKKEVNNVEKKISTIKYVCVCEREREGVRERVYFYCFRTIAEELTFSWLK
jgi:hypothetical protein